MSGGAYRAVLETDLKRVFAYSTISALGVIMLLLGAGTPQAVAAALLYLLAHACYKGALFLIAGAIEHETGTRDVTALAGLRRMMPITAVAALLAAASMAGIPLTFGFIAKEQFYDALMMPGLTGSWASIVVAAAVAASACLGAAGLLAGVAPFAGRSTPSPARHEAPASLWLGPLVLAGVGLAFGVVPGLAAPVGLAAASVTRTTMPVDLAIWHGFSPTLMLSAVTIAGSLVLFTYRDAIRRRRLAPRSPDRACLHPYTRCRRDGQPPPGAGAAERVAAFVCLRGRGHRRELGGYRPGHRRHPAGIEPADADRAV